MTKQEFVITGMTCKHCVQHVTESIESLAGVKKVKVQLKKSTGTVQYDEALIQSEDICKKVEEAGYHAEVK